MEVTNMKKALMALILVGAMLFSVSTTSAKSYADKILHNGKVFTAESQNTWAQAIAIKGKFIIKVGTNEDVLELQDSNTDMIDLEGKTVLPGFNDAHTHMLPYVDPVNGMFINDPFEFVPNPGPTVQEMLGLIQYLDTIIPPNIAFYGIVGENFIEDPMVSRFLIDTVAPNRPVVIFGWAGHFVVINTVAMQAVGLSETQPDLFAGSYDRVEGTDIINGVLREYAGYDIARRVRSTIPDEVFQIQLAELFQGCLQMGYTSVQDVPIGITNERYKTILESMDVPIRIRNIAFPFDIQESEALFNGFGFINPLDKVQSAGIKWISDGTPQESYMALSEEYADQPGWCGVFNFQQDDFNQMIRNARFNFKLKQKQTEIHAQGDRAIQTILDTMSNTGSNWIWRLRRLRIVHGDLILPEQYSGVASKGICVMKIPNQFIKGEVFFRRLGPARFQYVQPLKSLIESGVKVVLCSDTLGGVGNPFLDIKLAMFHPTNPNESIDIETAIICHTKNGAYSEYMEPLKGTIKAGKLADIIVLSQDIFDPAIIPTMENTISVLTIVDGEIVWNAGI